MRAREPDETGVVDHDGVRVPYEVFGTGGPTLLLLPAWAIVHARQWKMQVPYLARHHRVIVLEVRGNGAGDRPTDPAAYSDEAQVGDAVAVLDATGTEQAVVVGLSGAGRHALQMAAWHPDRVLGVVAIAPALPVVLSPGLVIGGHDIRDGMREFAEFFFAAAVPEPHSVKHREDGVGWALETTAEVLLATEAGLGAVGSAEAEATARAVRCPVLVVHGDADLIVPHSTGAALAEWCARGELVTLVGSGHNLNSRDPVRVNLLISSFAARFAPPAAPRTWTRAAGRRRRALLVCSPIGLGHVRRDLAIADELRVLHPDVEIEWLTQHPVTRVLADRGETVHPASRWLASESAHIEAEAGEHDLHAFGAIRRMDEILAANFMVFHDVVAAGEHDLWIADEGWEVDHFLFDNPELKRTPYAWLTDFVGWLPMADGGPAEAALTADWNAESVERMRRRPRLRDRSIFVGEPADMVDLPLGPGLPTVREWGQERYSFAGYVTGREAPLDRDAVRAELGYRPGEPVCLVTVGGSGVGRHLLERLAAAFPIASRAVAGLRMVLVAGPRIDPGALTAPPGVEVLGYVPDLDRHLAACDLAVVQGGLSTTMELVAARRPFLYVPLQHHFEQQVHVPQRLAQYRAGCRVDWADADPDHLASLIAAEIGRPVDYREVATGGAARAAAMLAELL